MNQSIDMLEKLMDATTMRQRVLSDNLANTNTPGFIRKDVRFKDALVSAMKSPEKMAKMTPEIYEDTNAPVNDRGNSVSMQRELGEISENNMLYNFAAEMIMRKFSGLQKAINNTK